MLPPVLRHVIGLVGEHMLGRLYTVYVGMTHSA
jgi:hypothetical protein